MRRTRPYRPRLKGPGKRGHSGAVVLLTGLPCPKTLRFQTERSAARTTQRNEKPKRKHLPRRRVGHVQNGQTKIVAERLPHIKATATPQEGRFEKCRNKARCDRKQREWHHAGTQPIAGQHSPDHQPEKDCR